MAGYSRSKPAQATEDKVTPTRLTALPVGATTRIRKPRVTKTLVPGVRKEESAGVSF